MAAQEARLQVLEGGPRPLLQVGTPVAEDQPARRVRKGQAGRGRRNNFVFPLCSVRR